VFCFLCFVFLFVCLFVLFVLFFCFFVVFFFVVFLNFATLIYFQEVDKPCRCGQTHKRVACSKPLLCERRCEAPRQCGRHACRRKCCTGLDCPPCEEVCGRKLQCQNHKCQSPCHLGPCYPCPLTVTLACACGSATVTLPCGRERQARPPQCSVPCQKPSQCHHPAQAPHPCHQGACPPCAQPCSTTRACGHVCLIPCHDPPPEPVQPARSRKAFSAGTASGGVSRSNSNEASSPSATKPKLPLCPPCTQPVPTRCVGDHQSKSMPCHLAAPFACSQLCGRLRSCGEHSCPRTCHDPCEGCGECTSLCSRPRPAGCSHKCPQVCHVGSCPDCQELLRMPCHCGALIMHPLCFEFLICDATVREQTLSCRGACPKTISCGHPCALSCHSGPCSDASACRKKCIIKCPCQRRRVDYQCRNRPPSVECDEDCHAVLEEKERLKRAEAERLAAVQKAREEVSRKRLCRCARSGICGCGWVNVGVGVGVSVGVSRDHCQVSCALGKLPAFILVVTRRCVFAQLLLTLARRKTFACLPRSRVAERRRSAFARTTVSFRCFYCGCVFKYYRDCTAETD
jgi:NF-X1-type zinc finger protein NFXL1